MLAVIETKRVEPATKMMDHKRSPVSIEQGSLASLTPKRQKAGLSMSSKERKEKVGERVAALQQLVSPYGKEQIKNYKPPENESSPTDPFLAVMNKEAQED